jgi:hypothetical protein
MHRRYMPNVMAEIIGHAMAYPRNRIQGAVFADPEGRKHFLSQEETVQIEHWFARHDTMRSMDSYDRITRRLPGLFRVDTKFFDCWVTGPIQEMLNGKDYVLQHKPSYVVGAISKYNIKSLITRLYFDTVVSEDSEESNYAFNVIGSLDEMLGKLLNPYKMLP